MAVEMFKHGLNLRLGFITFNNQVFKSVITPNRYFKHSVNIKNLVVTQNYGSHNQRCWYSSIAAVPNPDQTGSETTPILDNESIKKKRGDKNEIGDTLKNMVVEKVKSQHFEESDIASRPQKGNKWEADGDRRNVSRPRRAVKSRFNTSNDDDAEDVDKEPLTHSQKWADRELEENPYKGKLWTNEQERLLYDELEKVGTTISNAEWDVLKEKVLAAGNFINNLNIDASIMGICITFKNLTTGKSFFNHLTTDGGEPNIATIGKFLKLCYVCSSEVDDETRSKILSIYDDLRAKHPVLDAGTAENVVHGISVTDRWKEGLELLEEIRLTCSPNTSTCGAMAQSAFDHDEPETGWDLVSKMLVDNKKPSVHVFEAWLRYAHRVAAGNIEVEQKHVERMLDFFANNDIRLSEDTVRLVRHWYEYSASFDDNWDVEYTTVDQRGQCQTCRRYLSPLSLGLKEFESLRSAFLDKALVGSNVFLKSTPEELEEFKKFVKKTAPYDIVIDGLNVGYSGGAAGKGNPRTFSRMLQSVVQHFVRKGQKVLVLGRRHMYNWPRENMDYIYENAEVFLAENLSQDDPFLLYAAMYSGLGTCFISRDLMRSHLFLLKDQKLQSSFRRWQKQHQYQVLYIEQGGNVRMRAPLKFSTSTQRGRNGAWHVPYDLDSVTSRAQALLPPFQWLCMKKNVERDYDDFGGDRQFEKPRYQERDARQMNRPNNSFRSRQSEYAYNDLPDENEKPLVSFKPQQRKVPHKEDYGSDSDDFEPPPRNSRYQRKPSRKTDDWDV